MLNNLFSKKSQSNFEIKLLSPQNGALIDIAPEHQEMILCELKAKEGSENAELDWANPEIKEKDNTHPKYTIFSWGYEGSMSEIWEVNLLLSQSKDFADADIYEINPMQPFLPVTNLRRSSKYYWKMDAFGKKGKLYESEVFSFTTSAALPQWYFIEGTTNVRDLGGIPLEGGREIKSGMVIRGAETDGHFPLSAAGLDFLKNELSINTDLDMRRPDEVITEKDSYYKRKINIPIFAYDQLFTAASEKKKLKDIFEIFADSSAYPIYIHCIAGADRTGCVAALLEALLGADEDSMGNDFEFTSLSLIFGIRSRNDDYYKAFLSELYKYGNTPKEAAEAFLLDCGVTEQQIENIRKILTA